MAIIKKKCWPREFAEVLAGTKKLELRLNDFDAAEGDTLILQEFDPNKNQYTGREVTKKIGAVMRLKPDSILYWTKEEIDKYGLQIFLLE